MVLMMTTAVKLGKYAKAILLLMFKSDEPPGNPNLIWFDIYHQFEIMFNSLPKKYQPEMLNKEQRFRCVLSRLVKQGLIKPSVITRSDGSLCDPRGYGHNYYSLTKKGRLVAEKLQQPSPQQLVFLRDQEDLKKALQQLYALGHTEVLTSEVREVLWQQHQHQHQQLFLCRFGDGGCGGVCCRVDFDRYWNNTRLGLMLKKCTVGQVRVGVNSRQRKYCLGNP